MKEKTKTIGSTRLLWSLATGLGLALGLLWAVAPRPTVVAQPAAVDPVALPNEPGGVARAVVVDALAPALPRAEQVPPDVALFPGQETPFGSPPPSGTPRSGLSAPTADRVPIRWLAQSGSLVAAMEQVVADFNASQSTISLTLEAMPYAEAQQALQEQIDAGDPPDIVGPFGILFDSSFHGQWLDLSPMIASTGYTLTDYYTKSLSLYQEDGELLGLPFVIYPSFVFYNRDLFDSAGLAYPPHQYGQPYTDTVYGGAWTTDKLAEIARLLTLDNMGRNSTAPTFDADNIVQFGYIEQWMGARGEVTLFGADSFVDANGDAQIPINWRTAFHWYYDAMWGSQPFIPNDGYIDSDQFGNGNPFNSNHVAMAHTHLWCLCCLPDVSNWDIAATPAYSGVTTSKMHSDGFRIIGATEHPTEAFQALTYVVGDGAPTLFDAATNSFPARISLQSAALDDLEATYPGVDWQVMIDSIDYADVPNHQGYMPNLQIAENRLNEFYGLYHGIPGLDVDAELEILREDLQAIFNYPLKTATPQGEVSYGDLLTYTVVVSATPGTQLGFYDPLTDTTFVRFVEQPAGIVHDDDAITGTFIATPTQYATVAFVVQVDVPTAPATRLINRACVYDLSETLDECQWSNRTYNALPAPDVGVWKWNPGGGHARPGGVAVYVIEYHNDGNGAAADTLIVDTLPLSTTYAGDTSGFPHVEANGIITWNLGTLPSPGNGDNWGVFAVTLDVDEGLSEGEGALAENCATISTSTPGDTNPGNESSCAGPIDVWKSDVGVNIDKWSIFGDPTPGQEFEYHFRWCTDRSADFGPVWLTDTLPVSTTFVSWWTDWPWNLWTEVITTGGQFVLYAPGLPGNYCQQTYLRLLLDPAAPPGTVLQNTIVITTPGDVDPGNNRDVDTDASVGVPRYDMRVDKNMNSGVLASGGWIDYHVSYWNQGNSAVHAWLTDTLPEGATYQPDSAREQDGGPVFPPALVTDEYVVWDLGVIGVNQGLGLDFTVDVSDTVATDTVITNCASVGITATEDTPADNTACVPVTINDHGPNLRVTKRSWWNDDSQLGYQIQFYNVGDQQVNDVWITDTLPISTTWDGWWNLQFDGSRLISESLDSQALMWEFSTLYPGDSGGIEFNANLDAPGTPLRWYTNTVEIATYPDDVVPGDNAYQDVAFSGGEVRRAEMFLGTDDADMWGEGIPGPVTITTAYTQVVVWGDPGCNGCWNTEGGIGPIWPGDTVIVKAGAGILPVTIVVPDPFDVAADSTTDTVWGQIAGAANQQVQIHGYWPGGYRETWTNADGEYSVTYDVPRGAQGHVRYQTTIDYAEVMFHRRFQTEDLAITVNYPHDWVEGNYEAGHTVWLTVTDSGGSIKATAELTTGVIPWWGEQTGFSTNLGEPWQPQRPDIEVGDWVYGETETGYTTTVRVGEITGYLDLDSDRITGTVHASWFNGLLNVQCWIDDVDDSHREFTVDADGGAYTCDFSSVWDLTPNESVSVQYQEPDGDWVRAVFQEPTPYVRIEKSASGNPAAGGNFRFNIQYWNDGDDGNYAESVLITDTLLGGMTYIADTSGTPHTGSGSGPIVWNLGTVDGNTAGSFDVFVAIAAGEGDVVTNTVQITSSSPYNQSGPGERYSEWSGAVQANDTRLSLGKWINGPNPAPGTDFDWMVNVCNDGGTASSKVTLTDTLPISTTLLGWRGDTSGWSEVLNTDGQLVLSYPSIPDGQCTAAYLRFHLDEDAWMGMWISNTATITASNDLNGGSTATDQPRVYGPYSNLYVRRDWLQGQLVPGGQTIYEVQYGNDGNAPADDVLITYTLPVSTAFDNAWWNDQYGQHPFAPDTVTADYVIWNLGTLENGYGSNFGVRLDVDSSAVSGTVLTSTFEITPHPTDYHYDDNAVTWVETLNDHGPNLAIHKQNHWWNGTGQIRYEMRIKNRGTERLEPVWITDTYPISTTWDENWWYGHGPQITTSHDAPNHQIIFWLEYLDPGETASINFQVDLDGAIHGTQGLLFTNTLEALVSGDVYPADNYDQVVAYAGPDVYTEKWLRSGEPRPGEVVTFTVKFGNQNAWQGISDVWGSYITDTLPPEMAFITAATPWDPNQHWYPDGITGTTSVRWSSGTPWSSNDWYFAVVARITDTVQSGDVIINLVEYHDDNPDNVDRFPGNNVFTLPLTIINPKFEIGKGYDGNRVAGTSITCTLTVTNVGNEVATGVIVSDSVPTYLTGVTVGDGTLQLPFAWWQLGPVAPGGGTVTATFQATLPCTAGLTIVNDDYGVRGSDQGVSGPPGEPVNFTVLTPTLLPAFAQSATQIDADTTVYFTNTSTTDGTDIVGWAWDFGDGGTGSGEVVSHTYGGADAYTVTLTITDACGISKSEAVPDAVTIAQSRIFLPLVLRNL